MRADDPRAGANTLEEHDHSLVDQPLAEASGQERRPITQWRWQCTAPLDVRGQRGGQSLANRYLPRFVELRLPYRQYAITMIDVAQCQPNRLADSKPSAIEQQQQCAVRQGLQGAERRLQDGGGIQQPLQFVGRIDIGSKRRRQLGALFRQNRHGDMASCNREAVQARKQPVLGRPSGAERATAQERGNLFRCHLRKWSITRLAGKLVQGPFTGG
jgi:hypothetical protein